MSRLSDFIRRLWRGRPAVEQTAAPDPRVRRDIIVILDGTLSSLEEGHETNAGLTYRLLQASADTHTVIR